LLYGGSLPTNLDISIAQISDITGAGHAREFVTPL
jgi:hypothetical protein